MKSRETLIRLQQWQVDDIRRRLAGLEGMRADLERKAKEIESTVADERGFGESSPIGAFAFPSFVRAMSERREKLEKSIEGVDREIETAKSLLADAYGELKKFEELEESRMTRERATRARREQNELDDIALKTYRRRQVENQA